MLSQSVEVRLKSLRLEIRDQTTAEDGTADYADTRGWSITTSPDLRGFA
jgi:hypothetical protein